MKNRPILLAAATVLLGATLDFIFNGVFKIIWIVIYGPAYLAAATILDTQLFRTRFKDHARLAAITLILGAAVSHLALTGRRVRTTYPMSLLQADPAALGSSLWPQRLIVSSAALTKGLAGLDKGREIPVLTERITDYGCTRSFEVVSVAGVDVRSDPDSRWTWKTDPHAVEQAKTSGPGNEDQVLPWCRIQFYRGVH